MRRTQEKDHRGRYEGRPLAVRFAEKTAPATDPSPNGMEGCIVWTGFLSGGYGRISVNAVPAVAHVVAWELAGRSRPEGRDLDHLCRRPSCVNVAHLEPVTRQENLRRGVRAIGRTLNAEKVHEIRSLAAAGWRTRCIAAAYGVGTNAITDVTSGRTWSYV